MTKSTSPTSKDIKAKAKSVSEDLSSSARETAQDAAGAVREEAARRADSAKSGVADEVLDIASALRKAADDMRDGSPQERTFGQIAGGLADVSDSIRGKDLGEMASELTTFAKRNPMLFLGGIALAGFAATRFATASARRDDDGAPSQSSSEIYAGRHTSGAPADFSPVTPNRAGGTS
ncbi:hypothetical protein [Roseovarius sp. Pro17]|uniref:hypothetical protein n=1 Tax=Roseovarius sp. Pro17 TaxID=3108175 RepID=UPI002D78B69B|nr:hypothetical protein [Roseovarius sp. Pro17]